jgi:mRNA degradation ribonuclease J1/J2
MDAGPEAELLMQARRVVAEAADARPSERFDGDLMKERVRLELRRFLKKRTQRRPMVVPVVMEV